MRVPLLAAAVLMMAAACAVSACTATPSGAPTLRVAASAPSAGVDDVMIAGLPGDVLADLSRAGWTPAQWQALLWVTAGKAEAGTGLPPVAGTYRVDGGEVHFRPAFPLDPGLSHLAHFDPARLPRHQAGTALSTGDAWRQAPMELRIPATRTAAVPSTRVDAVVPADTLLENQLRLYIHFSAPMGTRGVQEHVRLLDERGGVVEGAFLPLDLGLWDRARRRYTLLFDPGRVKRGILPHMQRGRPLRAGRRYTLEIDRDWQDGEGLPLAASFRRSFTVSPAVLEPLVPADWRLILPARGTRTALTVQFPRALDPALVERTLFVQDAAGHVLDGDGRVEPTALGWTFTPAVAWTAGAYLLGASPELEDQAGNRVGRPFDFDPAHPGRAGRDGHRTQTEARLPFTLR